jgi:hypothetical protein
VFWQGLPRWLRQGKHRAFGEWTKAALEGDAAVHEKLKRALGWQRKSDGFERDNRGKLTAASYLRGRRWEDEPLVAPTVSAAPAATAVTPPVPREPWPERTEKSAAKPLPDGAQKAELET